MKKAIKLLSLAMLFAMPLAACGGNDNGGNGGNDEGGGNQGGGSDGSTVSKADIEAEAKRIASEYFEIDVDEIEIGDYLEENSEDFEGEPSYVTEYSDSDILFCDVWDYAEDDVSGTKSMILNYVSGAKAVTTYGFEEDEYGEYSYYYKANGFGYNIYIYDMSDDEGDFVFWTIDVFDEKKMSKFDSFMYGDGEDIDDEEDDDDEGGGGDFEGTVTIDFSTGLGPSGKVGGVSYSSDGLTVDGTDGHAYNQLRVYTDGTLTISASSNISTIEFTFKDKKGPLTSDVGKINGTTWTGSAKSVTFTASAQARIVSIIVK